MKEKYELIIAEKSDAAKRIAEALSDSQITKKDINKVPYYEITRNEKKIVVCSAVGHLFILAEKEKTGWKYPSFDICWKPSSEVAKKAAFTKKYLQVILKLAKDASSFVIACDLDTEGELIGFNVLRFICNAKNAKRMKFSTLTKQEIIDSYENASDHINLNLAEAGETRHFMDHYYGINTSRALTLAVKNSGKGFKILSSGRVQSPVLSFLAQREKEIENFKPVPFWQIFADIIAKGKELKLIHEKEKFWEKKQADQVLKRCSEKKPIKAIVSEIKKTEFKSLQPAPFNITTLQTESYRLFGLSPKQTLDIAESLYLSAYISYPRTSSEKLDKRIGYSTILKALSKIKEFSNLSNKLLQKKTLVPREGKKTDPAHIAIYPTSQIPDLSKLNSDQLKLYSLIVKRFMTTFADPAIRETVEAKFNINNEIFYVKGSRTLYPGWFEFYEPYLKLDEIILPEFKKDEIYNVKKIYMIEDKTKPPKRYSQGSIIAEMEKRGLGTRATRSQILQTLYDRYYIEDKSVRVTKLGMKVVETLEKNVPELTSEKLTRHFEEEIEQVQEGKKKKEEILEEAREVLTNVLKEFKKKEKSIGKSLIESISETRRESSILGQCNTCKKGELIIMYSKKNKSYFIGCTNYPNCTSIFSLPFGMPKATQKLCDECKSNIVLMIRKSKRPFEYCINPNCKKKEEWLKSQNQSKS